MIKNIHILLVLLLLIKIIPTYNQEKEVIKFGNNNLSGLEGEKISQSIFASITKQEQAVSFIVKGLKLHLTLL